MSLGLKIFHKTPYPAIDPRQPKLSQAGKTVLVTGGNGGIGLAIARNFITAGARRVIIVGREGQAIESSTIVDGRICDTSDIDATAALWDRLEGEGIVVDVVVMNAASFGDAKSLLEAGRDRVWQSYITNVQSHLDFAERLYKQKGQGAPGRKYLINISTVAIYMWTGVTPQIPSYGLTKNSGTALMQQIAKDVRPEELQIVSIHPGSVLSDTARAAGLNESSLSWDDENLAGQTVVWASTPEAEFLHGRFVLANWDIEELMTGSFRMRLTNDLNFLKVGVNGLSESTTSLQVQRTRLD
ncbi:short chain dehydrogenase domain-containing protein [Trichoderma breve]|uniref:Short chain dehydrogenase domain-containing protein n=1 Tax=Trichoderma breve TaxID=2034170 RepID=A0A9W9BC10_9HYPO|nr:short chain dehydrogenase domain-containing protein [Trichoderma breve]KAJ4856796.1 short chain dehydrogenase domain-containing protein [Trichoderma breve]